MKKMAFPIFVMLATLFIVIYNDELHAMYEKYEFEKELESDYTVINLNLKNKTNIAFSGYKDRPCSMNLKTNSEELNFAYYNIVSTFGNSINWKTIAYQYNGIVYVANYIKEYTLKEDVLNYITQCDNEIYEKKMSVESNKKTWE